MPKDREVILLQLLQRSLEHLWDVVNALWTVLRQSYEKVFEDKGVLVLSYFASQLFSVDSCRQQDRLSDECLE